MIQFVRMRYFMFSVNAGKALPFQSCESIKVKDKTRQCENVFDGSLSRKVSENLCFVSQSSKSGWIEVMLTKTSSVSKIAFIPKGNG